MTDPATAFESMAERIKRNPKDEFGGCMLIVPPSGEIIDVLLIGSQADPVHFWATVKGKMEDGANSAMEKLQPNSMQGFPRR